MPVLCGVNVAAITPRRQASEPDVAAIFELLDFLGHSGVNGISLLGSTGEFVHFDVEERERLIALAIKRSRVPVIPGVSHSTLDGALSLARAAADAGADAVLLMPPYFFRYAQEDIREFYLCFARELHGSVPVLLYNIPQFTNPIECGTALDLLATGEFAGIKDSSGNWDDFNRLIEARRQYPFSLLIGNDAIYRQARQAGADGCVSGLACAVPELVLALDRSIMAGREDAAGRFEERLREFITRVEMLPAPVAIREALRLRGVHTGPCAAPLGPGHAARLGEFREWFQVWLPGVVREAAGA